MLKLMMTPRSPFARRVRVALQRLKIPFTQVELNVFEPTAEFLAANPLSLVPVLEVSPGQCLPDSWAILEYLDEAHPPGIWPRDPSARLSARRWSVWAEGIMSFTVSWYLESLRKQPDPGALNESRENILRTLQRLEGESTTLATAGVSQPLVDLAIALDYLSLRIHEIKWRDAFPGLVPLWEEAQRLPGFKETAPPPA
jgi:glutathione S-transferase